jgi:hypothetical protein
MKNYFRLEVFKNGTTVFDKQVPTLMFAQTITQWTSPELDYSIKITLDSGVTLTSEQWLNSDIFVKTAFTKNINHIVSEEKTNIDAELITNSNTTV